MVMAVAIFYQAATAGASSTAQALTIVCGFESGHTTVVSRRIDSDRSSSSSNAAGSILYTAQPHSQPILSLDVAPDQSFYLTSGADAIIAKHPIPMHSAQSLPTSSQPLPTSSPPLFPASNAQPAAPITQPLKTSQTKHSGQQGLTIRNDARIFATAGWDARVRVYATASLRELAVLKWHKEGCFAVALAHVAAAQTTDKASLPTAARIAAGSGNAPGAETKTLGEAEGEAPAGEAVPQGSTDRDLVPRMAGLATTTTTTTSTAMLSPKEKRIRKAAETHWLAAGSKDGKVSLWEIY